MDIEQLEKQRLRSLRLVQMITLITGISFIVAGVVLYLMNEAGDSSMQLIAIVLVLVGIGDLVIAFFLFQRMAEGEANRPEQME